MHLSNISITHFRNFSSQSVSFESGRNVILGENGAGKTNLLEGIFFYAPASRYTPPTKPT